jgi:hypothetical protein
MDMGFSVGKLVKGVTKGASDIANKAGKAVGGAAKADTLFLCGAGTP